VLNLYKIIIDTDIGDDVDDALAIALALKSPEVELIGITTVFKDTDKRAKLTKKLLEVAGFENIPVYAGCRNPIIEKVDATEIPNQYSSDMDNIEYNSDLHAVDYLITTILQSNEDIIIVAIGPLTNLATAIIVEPKIKAKLKGIVMMGGSYSYHCNEYNILLDPEAAKIVFSSGIPIKALGIDITKKCTLTSTQLKEMEECTTELGTFLMKLSSRWFKAWGHEIGTIILHDPLAVYAVFDKNLIKFSSADVKVETRGEFTRGFTFAEYDNWKHCFKPGNGRIMVAEDVNSVEFTHLFMNRLFK